MLICIKHNRVFRSTQTDFDVKNTIVIQNIPAYKLHSYAYSVVGPNDSGLSLVKLC